MHRRFTYLRPLLIAAAVLPLAFVGTSPASADLAFPEIAPPKLDSVQPSGTTVTLHFTDRSTNESAFDIWERDPSGTHDLGLVDEFHSNDPAGTGGAYTRTENLAAGRQCFTVIAWNGTARYSLSNEVCTAPPPAVTPPAPEVVGGINSVATGGITGITSSTAMGSDGYGLIAYYAGGPSVTGQNLRVSHCVDAECSAVTSTTVDSAGDVGKFASLQFGGDGLPLITYTSVRATGTTLGARSLKVAHCLNADCTQTTITTIDSTSSVGAATSLTIGGDGLGLIGYEDYNPSGSSAVVKVAHCLNPACTSSKISAVDTAIGRPAGFDKVAIATNANGLGLIGYYDQKGDDLKTAACENADCSSRVVPPNTIATDGGTEPSIAIGRDGMALISYQGVTAKSGTAGSELRVAHCANLYCTQASSVRTLLTGGSNSSIGIGGDGLGLISHYDRPGGDLVVSHCSNIACSAVTTTAVDTNGDVGQQSSLTIGTDRFPLISYLDSSNDDLKVAHCTDVLCAVKLVATSHTVVITSNSQQSAFVQAVAVAWTTVRIAASVNMDLSGRANIHVAPGVQILGDRAGSTNGGPRLFTTTFPRALLVVDRANNVRISGIRFDGQEPLDPSASVNTDDADGIRVNSSLNVEIDHDEFTRWRGSAVNVADDAGVIGLQNADTVWVHDNYIHDNQHPTVDTLDPIGTGHGAGYGVALSSGGYALIERNVFEANRHSITGDGKPGTGYLAYRNLFLSPGVGDVRDGHIHFTQIVDMHGRDDCLGSYNCGPAGEYADVAFNAFPSTSSTDIKLRGTPARTFDVEDNVFAHTVKWSSLLTNGALDQTTTGLQDRGGNVLGATAFNTPVRQCDFDGDGVNDPFMATGVTWWFAASSQAQRWTYLNQSPALVSGLTLGDVDGDHRCDVTVGGSVFRTPPVVNDSTSTARAAANPVPDVAGLVSSQAVDVLKSAGYAADVRLVGDANCGGGPNPDFDHVMSQDPAPGIPVVVNGAPVPASITVWVDDQLVCQS